VNLTHPSEDVSLTVGDLKDVMLWDVEKSQLYDLVAFFLHDLPIHIYKTRVGFREARFELDGFFSTANGCSSLDRLWLHMDDAEIHADGSYLAPAILCLVKVRW
jgi:hypothetical protein